MSRKDKTRKFQCSMTKMTFCPVVQSFFIVSLYFVSEFKKIPSIPDHMLEGHLIVWNNVPGGQNDYFEQKGPQTDIHCSKYSLNIAQDPTYPSIWKYLSRNIFDHKRNSFLSNVPGGQKWKSLSMWQFRKELKIRWKQFVTLLMNKYNQNITKIWLLYVTTTL